MLRPLGVVLSAFLVLTALPAPLLAEGEAAEAEATPAEEAPAPEAASAPEAAPAEAEAEAEADADADAEAEAEPEETPEIPSAEGAAEPAPIEGAAAAASETSEGEAVAVETIEATVDVPPAAEGEAAETASAEPEAPAKPWSATISHSFGWGLQTDDAISYSDGSLAASGTYKVIDKVVASASVGMRYTLDGTPNDGVRADLGAISLGLNHASLYNDEDFTGLNLNGGVSFSQSLGMGTLKVGRGPTLGARVGLSRKVGPVGLSYGLGFNRFFPVDATPRSSDCAEDRGDPLYCIGGYANAWAISNSVSANYSPLEELSLSASFMWNAARSFASTKADQYTSTLLGDPTNRRESFGFSLSGTYTTPIEGLSAGLTFSNARPWRTDGQTLAIVDFSHGVGMVFDSRFAAMSLDVSYSF
ncbi:MAG: hypothetical protein P1V51_12215 [Deltaproteobacteria bacterium]|nr:hypothetical protein [Deltaproteobacteria bacterium]